MRKKCSTRRAEREARQAVRDKRREYAQRLFADQLKYGRKIYEAYQEIGSLYLWCGHHYAHFTRVEFSRHRRLIDKTTPYAEERLLLLQQLLRSVPWLRAYEKAVVYECEVWSIDRRALWKGPKVPKEERETFKRHCEEGEFNRQLQKATQPLRDARRALRDLKTEIQYRTKYAPSEQRNQPSQ